MKQNKTRVLRGTAHLTHYPLRHRHIIIPSNTYLLNPTLPPSLPPHHRPHAHTLLTRPFHFNLSLNMQSIKGLPFRESAFIDYLSVHSPPSISASPRSVPLLYVSYNPVFHPYYKHWGQCKAKCFLAIIICLVAECMCVICVCVYRGGQAVSCSNSHLIILSLFYKGEH